MVFIPKGLLHRRNETMTWSLTLPGVWKPCFPIILVVFIVRSCSHRQHCTVLAFWVIACYTFPKQIDPQPDGRVVACLERIGPRSERMVRSGPVGRSLSSITFAPATIFAGLFAEFRSEIYSSSLAYIDEVTSSSISRSVRPRETLAGPRGIL